MKKKNLALIFAIGIVLTGCGSTASEATSANDTEITSEETSEGVSEETSGDASENAASAVKLTSQGNSNSVRLSEIAEQNGEDYNAWLKISTQYDPDLSMFNYDSAPADASAIIVDFSVTDFDLDESTLYWGYQLVSGGSTTSVWDTSSPADTLTVTSDGDYRIVFNADTALGGPIESIESFQLVFPCTDSTNTKVTVNSVTAITDEADLQYYTTGLIN
jgi:uncharacterized protein YceK